jgi:hypothetical protein
MLTGERRRGGANREHLRVAGDTANSPVTQTTANDNRIEAAATIGLTMMAVLR